MVYRRICISLMPAVVLLLLSACPADSKEETTQLFKVDLKGGYFETEMRYENQRGSESGVSVFDKERMDVRPKVHLDLDGSIYHSYLLDYSLSMDLGVSLEYEQFNQPASGREQSRSDKNQLQYYHGSARILKQKKLSGVVFGSKSLVRMDNDFASRHLFDQTVYGGGLSYKGSVVPWTLRFQRSEDQETDTLTPGSSQEDEISFQANNTRGSWGRTAFNYRFQDFTRDEFNIDPYSGTRLSANLLDTMRLIDNRVSAVSSINYNNVDSEIVPSTSLIMMEGLDLQHSDSLKSYCNYTHSIQDSGSTESDSKSGRIGLRHNLYESLRSVVEGEIQNTEHTTQNSFRYGGRVDESYTKRIGESSMLSLGAGYNRQVEDRETFGTGTSLIVNEPHILQTGQITTLDEPDAIPSSLVVTDGSGTILYSEFIDYLVIPRGSLTEVERVITGNIPDGGSVLVTYESTRDGSGEIETMRTSYRFRLSLAEQLLVLYGHLYETDNVTDIETFVLENIQERVMGVESTWKRVTAGTEYREYDSSLLPTRGIRFFQRFSLPLSPRAGLQLSAEQNLLTYIDSNEEVERFSYSAVYSTRFTSKTDFRLSGNYYREKRITATTINRSLLAARAELSYHIAKTAVSFSAEYRDEMFEDVDRERATAWLKWRRIF